MTENGEEDRQEAGGVASINYIVLDLDPTSASEAGPITPGTKAGDPVPVTSGHFYASIKGTIPMVFSAQNTFFDPHNPLIL